jgi:hypothetical protein
MNIIAQGLTLVFFFFYRMDVLGSNTHVHPLQDQKESDLFMPNKTKKRQRKKLIQLNSLFIFVLT